MVSHWGVLFVYTWTELLGTFFELSKDEGENVCIVTSKFHPKASKFKWSVNYVGDTYAKDSLIHDVGMRSISRSLDLY
jgi:hypothetical protein